MSTQIESISIKRFKQLAEFQLDLKDTTVLIGANNAGKSSALQALHFAVSVAQTAKLVGDGVNWAKDKFQVSFNPTQLLYTAFRMSRRLTSKSDMLFGKDETDSQMPAFLRKKVEEGRGRSKR